MSWKTFLQIVLLSVIAGVIFYVVYPKYEFTSNGFHRMNRITGQLFIWGKQDEGKEANKNNEWIIMK